MRGSRLRRASPYLAAAITPTALFGVARAPAGSTEIVNAKALPVGLVTAAGLDQRLAAYRAPWMHLLSTDSNEIVFAASSLRTRTMRARVRHVQGVRHLAESAEELEHLA